MNREEFCKILVESRKNSGLSAADMSFSLKMIYNSVYRFESAKHNFKMDRVFDYLTVTNSYLVISIPKKSIKISSYDEMLKVVVGFKAKFDISYRKLAEMTGLQYMTFSFINSKKSIMSIDTFLSIMKAFNCIISIEPKES